MTDLPSDDARLRSTEAQMRDALGLSDNSQLRLSRERLGSGVTGTQPHKHRFVREGEVPVTILRRERHQDGEPVSSQLEEARRALAAETTARKTAERSLAEAQIRIRDLQTKLEHERLAKDEAIEAVRQAEASKQAAEQLAEIQKPLPVSSHLTPGVAGRDQTVREVCRSKRRSPPKSSLSRCLRSARCSRGLSVAELAERVGVSTASIYLWETDKGRPREANLSALCRVLKLPMRATRELASE